MNKKILVSGTGRCGTMTIGEIFNNELTISGHERINKNFFNFSKESFLLFKKGIKTNNFDEYYDFTNNKINILMNFKTEKSVIYSDPRFYNSFKEFKKSGWETICLVRNPIETVLSDLNYHYFSRRIEKVEESKKQELLKKYEENKDKIINRIKRNVTVNQLGTGPLINKFISPINIRQLFDNETNKLKIFPSKTTEINGLLFCNLDEFNKRLVCWAIKNYLMIDEKCEIIHLENIKEEIKSVFSKYLTDKEVNLSIDILEKNGKYNSTKLKVFKKNDFDIKDEVKEFIFPVCELLNYSLD